MHFMYKICQTVRAICITSQFHDFFEYHYWRGFAIWSNPRWGWGRGLRKLLGKQELLLAWTSLLKLLCLVCKACKLVRRLAAAPRVALGAASTAAAIRMKFKVKVVRTSNMHQHTWRQFWVRSQNVRSFLVFYMQAFCKVTASGLLCLYKTFYPFLPEIRKNLLKEKREEIFLILISFAVRLALWLFKVMYSIDFHWTHCCCAYGS